MTEHYDPTGIEFYDARSGKLMKLITEGHMKDWIVYKHVDGQWVTLREATEDDCKRISEAPQL